MTHPNNSAHLLWKTEPSARRNAKSASQVPTRRSKVLASSPMDGFAFADPSSLIIASRVDFASRSSVCPRVPSCRLTCADDVITIVTSITKTSSGDLPILLITVMYLALLQWPCHSRRQTHKLLGCSE